MRQVWFPTPGPPEVMEIREAPDPTPEPDEVRIAVSAAGVNFADLAARQGMYTEAPPFPMVVGYEVAGVIDAVGARGSKDRIGESVVAYVHGGGYSTSVCASERNVVRLPEGLEPVEAASLPVAYTTAWMALRVEARVGLGDKVLIPSAAGGVGLATLDLCLSAGAEVWASAGPSKHDFLVERGAHHVLDSHASEWPETKMDIILDAQGGAVWSRALDSLRPGGKLIMLGLFSMSPGQKRNFLVAARAILAVPWLRFNPVAHINGNRCVGGVNMARIDDGRIIEMLEGVLGLWAAGDVHPHIHARVPLDEAPEAHRILHRRENLGKVVLVP